MTDLLTRIKEFRERPAEDVAEVRERAYRAVWEELGSDFTYDEAVADPAHAEGVQWAKAVADAALRALAGEDRG